MSTFKKITLTREGYNNLELKILKAKEYVIKTDKSLQRAVDCFGIGDEQYLDRLQRKLSAEDDLEVLEEMLENSACIDCVDPAFREVVQIGSKVRLVNHKYIFEVQLVSTLEADPIESKVSDDSPIGSSIAGRKLGDIVIVSMPTGDVEFTIESVD